MGIHATPRINDFAHAKRRWANTPPWKNKRRDSNIRPLAFRRDTHCAIRSTDDPYSPVYYRLYNMDCVTIHADGIVEIKGYPSKSTANFIDNVLSGYVRPLRLCDAYLVDGGRVVCGPDITIRLTGDYKQSVEVVKAEPFRFYALNRKKVNALFKDLRWREFKTWAPTAFDLLVGGAAGRNQLYDAAEEAFPEIFERVIFTHIWAWSNSISAHDWVAKIRLAIIRKNIDSLCDVEELPYCEDEQEYRRRVRAHDRAIAAHP